MRTEEWRVFLQVVSDGLRDYKHLIFGEAIAWRNDYGGMDCLTLRVFPRTGYTRISINVTALTKRRELRAREKLEAQVCRHSGVELELVVPSRELLAYADWCVERVQSGAALFTQATHLRARLRPREGGCHDRAK